MDKRTYYTVSEFAELMRVTERTVYRWIKLGVVQADQKMRGGEYRISRDQVNRFKEDK